MWDEIYMRVQWTVPFISYGIVGYDGQVGCDTYSVKLDDSPISRSTVGYVGRIESTMDGHTYPTWNSGMGYTWECSGQSHLSHIVEWDIVLVTHMGGGGGCAIGWSHPSYLEQ